MSRHLLANVGGKTDGRRVSASRRLVWGVHGWLVRSCEGLNEGVLEMEMVQGLTEAAVEECMVLEGCVRRGRWEELGEAKDQRLSYRGMRAVDLCWKVDEQMGYLWMGG